MKKTIAKPPSSFFFCLHHCFFANSKKEIEENAKASVILDSPDKIESAISIMLEQVHSDSTNYIFDKNPIFQNNLDTLAILLISLFKKYQKNTNLAQTEKLTNKLLILNDGKPAVTKAISFCFSLVKLGSSETEKDWKLDELIQTFHPLSTENGVKYIEALLKGQIEASSSRPKQKTINIPKPSSPQRKTSKSHQLEPLLKKFQDISKALAAKIYAGKNCVTQMEALITHTAKISECFMDFDAWEDTNITIEEYGPRDYKALKQCYDLSHNIKV